MKSQNMRLGEKMKTWIIPTKIKYCSSCGTQIIKYNEDNINYQGFLHCNNCLKYCLKERYD